MAFLILHGLEGSTADHWQSWLAGRLAETGHPVRFPALPDADAPAPAAWRRALDAELAALPGPPQAQTVICHSLGCLLWLAHASDAARRGDPPRGRALLVAPPSEAADIAELGPFLPAPLDGAIRAAARSTVLVCGDDDPYCPEVAATRYGAPLGLETHVVPGGGHLNPDTGRGPWPAVEAWCRGAMSAFGA